MTEKPPSRSRRKRYALETRDAILAAARRLFAEHGYFATKVDDIARAARVAPATVYAGAGGKPGLIAALIRQWSADPIIEHAMAMIAVEEDPHALIGILARTSRHMREEWADVVWILLTTAPHDEDVSDLFEAPTRVYRESVATIAQRLGILGALRADVDPGRAADILWFYFGYGSYLVLHDQNGWSYEEAERWLTAQATRELLGPSAPRET